MTNLEISNLYRHQDCNLRVPLDLSEHGFESAFLTLKISVITVEDALKQYQVSPDILQKFAEGKISKIQFVINNGQSAASNQQVNQAHASKLIGPKYAYGDKENDDDVLGPLNPAFGEDVDLRKYSLPNPMSPDKQGYPQLGNMVQENNK